MQILKLRYYFPLGFWRALEIVHSRIWSNTIQFYVKYAYNAISVINIILLYYTVNALPDSGYAVEVLGDTKLLLKMRESK